MITLSWQAILLGFVAVCAGFSTICVAVGWLLKIIKALKKPSDDVNTKLDNDNKRIKELENQFAFMLKALPLLLQDDLVILSHLRTNNNTGDMAKQEEKIHDFLLKR